jgi:hypothetical protein
MYNVQHAQLRNSTSWMRRLRKSNRGLIDRMFPRLAEICDRIASKVEGRSLQEEAERLYGVEMIEPILGDRWIIPLRNQRFPEVLLPRQEQYSVNLHAIFDHPIVYRRYGKRGPTTRKNAAVIGRPYNHILTNYDGIECAAYLWGLGIGVWIREDLSSWNPPHTCLVLAAEGLFDKNPEPFGFARLELT